MSAVVSSDSRRRKPNAHSTPTDIALVIVSVSTLALAIAFGEIATAFESQLSRLLDALPALLEPLWRTALWAPVPMRLTDGDRPAGAGVLSGVTNSPQRCCQCSSPRSSRQW